MMKKIIYFTLAISFFFSNMLAQDKQSNVDVTFYHIDLMANDSTTFISGSTRVDINVRKKTDSITLALSNFLDITRILLNKEEVPFKHNNDRIIIKSKFKKKKHYSIQVFYNGDGNDPKEYGAVINNSVRNAGKITYTLTEPYSSKNWFPCIEDMNDKADSVYVYISCSDKYRVGSNGLLNNIVRINDSIHQYQWHTKYPTAHYLISFAMGEYIDHTYMVDLPGGIQLPVVNYLYNNERQERIKEKLELVEEQLQTFSKLFGTYPFFEEKYGHCQVPFGGGMEHQTMTSLGSFDYNILAHELAHQWFGNYVTCSDWNNIWINEGFASYAEYLVLEFSDKPDRAKSWLKNARYYSLSKQQGTVYIHSEEKIPSSRVFDYALSYKKGACILHMLRKEINNDELFFNVLRGFLSEYAFSSASAEDFKKILKDFSGNDYDTFFNDWYYGGGYPELSVNWKQDGDSLYLDINQKSSAPELVEYFTINLPVLIESEAGDSLIIVLVDGLEKQKVVHVPGAVNGIVIDPHKELLLKSSVKEADAELVVSDK